ncbi:MAG: dethiobiotin synthase [Planctomycetota bacterium]|jgi:dethiobiotin synthase
MSLVVIGTDTEVGKTVVSAVVLARYARGRKLAYWKPIATGAEGDTDTALVRKWVGHRVDILDEAYLYDPPVSPHLAARLASRPIDPELVLAQLVEHGLEDPRRNLVVEGIGGLHVPLTTEGYLLSHLLSDMHLPCLLATRSGLGTINHTLLSLEAIRERKLDLAGVVMVGPKDKENKAAIEKYGGVKVTAELEWLPRLGRTSIEKAARRFDRRGQLKRYFEA